MKGYRELTVWQKSMDLVVLIYKLVKRLPKEENYVLSDQMRRAAVSIPSNIAEGHGRSSTREYLRFLSIASGSKNELETQLILCVSLEYLSNGDIEPAMLLCDEIGKMLSSIKSKLSPNPYPLTPDP